MTDSVSIRVLVVEDELVAAAYIRHKLHELGYEITATVPTGEQALEEVERRRPDIILMDIVLEGKLDGIDTAAIIKKNYGIPVIFLTSYSDEQKINRAITSQPFGYILKPIQERELHANIRMGLYKAHLDRQLKKSEQHAKAILQNSPLAIITCKSDFIADFSNERANELFAVNDGDTIAGQPVFSFLTEDAGQRVQLQDIIESQGKIAGVITRTHGFSGKPLVLRVSVSKFHASFEGYEFFIEDLTEKETLALEAKQAELKFNSLFHSPANPFILMNNNYAVEIYNEASRAFVEELTGNTLVSGIALESVFPGIQEALHTPLQELQNSETFSLDIAVPDIHEGSRWVELTFTKIAPEGTPSPEYSVYMKEVTERKQHETELRKSIAKLELQQNKLEQQSVELYYLNEKLLYSESNLKQLNANKDKFFSIIAHDLRSPFNNLLGFSEYLLEDFDLLDKETIRSIAGELNKSIKHVFELLNNLLQWSRIQAGRTDFNPEWVSLSSLITATVKLYGPVAAKKMVHIYPEILEDVTVRVDTNMFSSILQNLVSNAIKFTRKGGSVRLVYERTAEHHVLKVVDNGIGMSAEIIANLFKIEENVSRYGTEQEAGTGLGLILSKEFMEYHNGKLLVESVEQKGSVFTLLLPTEPEKGSEISDINSIGN